jgi:hypothetical protein
MLSLHERRTDWTLWNSKTSTVRHTPRTGCWRSSNGWSITRATPADLDRAKDILDAIADVCHNTLVQTADTYDQIMVGGIPAEAFESEASAPGFLLSVYAEEAIRWQRRGKA